MTKKVKKTVADVNTLSAWNNRRWRFTVDLQAPCQKPFYIFMVTIHIKCVYVFGLPPSLRSLMTVVPYLKYFFYFLLYIKRVLLMSVFHFIHSVWHEYQHRSQRMTLSTKVNNWKKKKCSKNDFRFPNEAWNFWWIWNDKIWASEEVPKEHNVNLKGVCDTTIYINLLSCLNKMLADSLYVIWKMLFSFCCLSYK